jgi:hypothetical protein
LVHGVVAITEGVMGVHVASRHQGDGKSLAHLAQGMVEARAKPVASVKPQLSYT